MCWRLLIDEYGHKLHYVKGSYNVVANVLNRLDLSLKLSSQFNESIKNMPDSRLLADAFSIDIDQCLLTYKSIMKAQQKDKDIIKRAQISLQLSSALFIGEEIHDSCNVKMIK